MHKANISISRKTGTGFPIQTVLLLCGLLSSLLWISSDVLASRLMEGYSYFHQTPSELSAIGASTTLLLQVTGITYNLLLIAFGYGVRMTVPKKSGLGISGGLLMAYGMINFIWFFVPMHSRGTGFTLTDILHIAMAVIAVAMVLFIVSFGARAFGRVFRNYSVITVLLLITFGILTFLQADRLASDQPTPWMGLFERINIYAYMTWVAVLSVKLLFFQPGKDR